VTVETISTLPALSSAPATALAAAPAAVHVLVSSETTAAAGFNLHDLDSDAEIKQARLEVDNAQQGVVTQEANLQRAREILLSRKNYLQETFAKKLAAMAELYKQQLIEKANTEFNKSIQQ